MHNKIQPAIFGISNQNGLLVSLHEISYQLWKSYSFCLPLPFWGSLLGCSLIGNFPALAYFLPFEPFLDGLEDRLATDKGHQLLSIV